MVLNNWTFKHKLLSIPNTFIAHTTLMVIVSEKKNLKYLLKRSRIRLAPWPTKISSNSEPAAWKNGTPASPATARANRVLPVPGGPTSNTPSMKIISLYITNSYLYK